MSEKFHENFNKHMNPIKESKNTNETIIIAPHPDDEIIGCFEVLMNPEINPIIIYSPLTDLSRQEEALNLKNYVGLKMQLFLNNVPTNLIDLSNTYYVPNPIYETHPSHRHYGNFGEVLLRNGHNVIFYSTEMNYHAKYECKTPHSKKHLLDSVYPSQKSLWENDHKYWLFSCYEKWMIL